MTRFITAVLLMGALVQSGWALDGVRVKELCRIGGGRDNALVGYGIVTGLAGTGDSGRSGATLQSLSNTLERFGVRVDAASIRARNTAAVMVTATLPPYAVAGDKIDINVTSIGDARSLLGGTLLLTHLTAPNGVIYALAQGPVSVGGYAYDLNGNIVQKNHPTAGYISGGAIVERDTSLILVDAEGGIDFVLIEPDFTTATRITESLNSAFGSGVAEARNAKRVRVVIPKDEQRDVVGFLTKAEELIVDPDIRAKVVVNERTGTVVSGGDVRVSQVSVTHGDLRVYVTTDYLVSQPAFVRETSDEVRTEVVADTAIEVHEAEPMTVNLPMDATVSDLVSALNMVKATSRDIISILQTVKRAGALHAELIIQ